MRKTNPIVSKIFVTACCCVALGACSPLKTGDLDRSHRQQSVSKGSSHESPVWRQAVLEPVVDVVEEERLQDDVEPEPEKTKAQELKDLEKLGKWEKGVPAVEDVAEVVKYDFPVTVNRQVQYYLDFFTGRHRKNFAVWLSRSGRYLPMIHEQLKAAGLPEDLAYLAMIESGYNERAYSRARAVGIWQFIKSTGRNYGLTINSYVDERRNPIKSTQAAVAYLSTLYKEFGSWYLAVAAYNAGEGKIRRAIKKYNTTDFWEIAQGRYLRLETKRYVPKLIAAIIIAKEPAKYGFTEITYEPRLAYDEVEVPRWTAIKAVALACNLTPKELKQYNNELRKGFTPPDRASYPFKVPLGKKSEVEKNLPRVQAVVTTGFKTHTVKKGETLTSICRKYGLTKTVILKSNNLRSAGLQSGQRLRIPYQTTAYEMLPAGSVAKGYLAAESADGSFILHKVLPGDTVYELARRYNVPIHLIAAWNDLSDISRIRAGQQLVLYVQDKRTRVVTVSTKSSDSGQLLTATSTKITVGEKEDTLSVDARLAAVRTELQDSSDYYIVQKGDSLWDIARQFNLDANKLKQINRLANNAIYPGDKLLINGTVRATAAADSYYQVRRGDSLWNIARSYDVAPEDIRMWNNLKNNTIHPGDRILIRLADTDELFVDTYYKVRRGDSLWIIARNHNISPEDIKRWNNLRDNTIHPGNRLLLRLAKGG
jgi:membrane-bound lytic murein transglycosylase D